MNKSLIMAINKAKMVLSKNSPQIFIGAGIAGFVSSTIMAVKATPKALALIDKAACEKEELSRLEKIKIAWKPYIPAACFGVLSIICVLNAQSVNTKRSAALATAYKLSERTLNTYKEKVIETIGEKKEKEIQGKVNKERLDKDPISKKEVIITGNGNSLFYDSLSGRYFESDIESIKFAINKLNRRMTYDMYVSLSDLYEEIGLSSTKNSDDLGWKLDDGLIEITFDTKLCEDGRPAIVLDYSIDPKYDYSKLI